MMTLYYAPNTCALASHIALETVGADYRTERLDFKAGEQRSSAYLKINAKGRVPALATGQGILTETPAILLYISQCHPAAGLAPLDDPFALAKVQEMNCYLCATVHVAHAHRQRAHRWADDEVAIAAMRRKVPENVAACFELIEHEMFEGPTWVLGDAFGIADMYLFTVARWLESDSVDIARFPKVGAHRSRMAELPAVRRALASHPVSG